MIRETVESRRSKKFPVESRMIQTGWWRNLACHICGYAPAALHTPGWTYACNQHGITAGNRRRPLLFAAWLRLSRKDTSRDSLGVVLRQEIEKFRIGLLGNFSNYCLETGSMTGILEKTKLGSLKIPDLRPSHGFWGTGGMSFISGDRETQV